MPEESRSSPFLGRPVSVSAPMRVLHRFQKHGGHWAEIRERTVTTFKGIEFIVFVDGSLLESEMFHGERLADYPAALAARIQQFVDGGWSETLIETGQSQ